VAGSAVLHLAEELPSCFLLYIHNPNDKLQSPHVGAARFIFPENINPARHAWEPHEC